ncbi:MAG TPA: hypothetical protein VJ965_12045 [Anaerolineales bacterium]|nr:hypothetical protein [Anaerolineales bacterium]
MLVPITHILPLTTIERRRFLPIEGEVFVRAGQEVRADEVIAKANLFAEHISLDLSRGLGVPKSNVTSYMKRKIGENVPQGGIIATKPGVVSRVVRAPKNGKLVAVGGGQALLQVSRKPYELKAGIPGTVFKVEADIGAVIQCTGAWIQGIWGNGKIGVGGLYVSAKDPDDILTAKDVDPSQRGQIMFSGHCADPKVLELLVTSKMRGLILGSMATRVMPVAARMPYPIIVLDGFGKIPINAAAFQLLSTSEQREITLNATPYNRHTGERPEAIMPVVGDVAANVPIELTHIEAGKQVRVVKSPYQGMIGTVHRLAGLSTLPNGLLADSAEIAFSEEEKVLIPLANLEILE